MNKIYARVLLFFGIPAQEEIAIEEMAELTKEIIKRRRHNHNDREMVDELADVEIMIEQLKQFYKMEDAVKMQKERKLKRLELIMDRMMES